MRIKRSRLTDLHLKKRITGKDAECSTYEEWSSAVPFRGEVWPASGKMQVQQYGERLNYILNMRIEGKYEIRSEGKLLSYDFGENRVFRENDGICVHSSKDNDPDYKIISIKPYTPLLLEIEKI